MSTVLTCRNLSVGDNEHDIHFITYCYSNRKPSPQEAKTKTRTQMGEDTIFGQTTQMARDQLA